MSTVIFWFRSDLRLHDQRALAAAVEAAHASGSGGAHLLPVVCLPELHSPTPWGFERVGTHRRAWAAAALGDLAAGLARLGNPLHVCRGLPAIALPALARAIGASVVVCEAIAAPYEQAEVAALRDAGLTVHTVWHSSLLQPHDMPWPVEQLPAVFTTFRQAVERAGIAPPAPLPAPLSLLPPPDVTPCVLESAGAVPWVQDSSAHAAFAETADAAAVARASSLANLRDRTNVASDTHLTGLADGCDPRSSFPYGMPACDGGETAALAHLAQYLARKLPHSYKATRNGLTGRDYSSKFSPWLATGALSARQVFADLTTFEREHGANDGTYWLWFELLWRDYFRFLHLQYGPVLYRAQGLSALPLARHNAQGFDRWCQGQTGEPLVDAAMRELAATGYLSNRLRQVAASYLVHDLQGDWRAGAAWFESQLVDYDVYSNQGNWLYIAGRGTDPRGGRRFNLVKQAQDHDADGAYRRLWGTL